MPKSPAPVVPPATILAVLNQKGGCGKTTCSVNLAVEFAQRGKRVLIVDTDTQHSASDWRSARGEDKTDVSVVSITNAASLIADVKTLSAGYDIVIIDGSPSVSPATAASVRICTAVVIPVQPTPRDLWGTVDIVDLIKARHAISDGLPAAVFLVTRTDKRTKLSREIDAALLDLGLPVLDSRMSNLQGYPAVDSRGLGVVEAEPRGPAAKEVRAIVDELIENKLV